MKVVIVGGVAGGATAAARIRRLDEQAEIVVFERSGYVSYANCGLPYFIGDVITDSAQLTLQTPESFWKRFHIQIRVRHEVIKIHPEEKTVDVRNLETGEEFSETYDKLLLSPGAKPILPNLAQPLLEGVFSLRTVEDTFRIHTFIKEKHPKRVVICGGGFIGLEMAENLINQGIFVTLVQRENQVLTPLDEDMAGILPGILKRHGVNLKLGSSVIGVERGENVLITKLQAEDSLSSDMVLFAIGVTPDTGLAREAGIALGIKGSIVVNDRMETSLSDIYAVGDAVEVKHRVSGAKSLISLAGPANKQGRIAADNICGGDSHFAGTMGSSILKLFDRTVASTGLNEKMACAAGICYGKVILSPNDHASYYPGAKTMTIKVLYEQKTLRILGAQIVGYEGVDKRIDVLATAIQAKMTALDLKDLDLAYAPPYSSAKDPVNMAGFMIENVATGKVKQFFTQDLLELLENEEVTLLDTRTAAEYERAHIEGMRNIPVDELRERLDEIPREKPVYVMCQSGLRSYIACRILSENGYDCYNFAGGYGFYRASYLEGQMVKSAFSCGLEKTE